MAELLIEFLSEEIPARMQAQAADDLKRLMTAKLTAAGLSFDSAVAHVTPRRLVLAVDGLPARRNDVSEERKGPRVGSPEKAVTGFLKSCGLESLDQCEERDTGKGVFHFAVIERKGGPTAEALGPMIAQVMDEFPWPKSMRWATSAKTWVRPLHSIIALFDGAVVEGGFDAGGGVGLVPFGAISKGHRFMAPSAFTVTGFADYRGKLEAASVILDREERKARIKADAEALCAAQGLTLKPDDGLLEEVCGLVEWPVALMGSIDAAFMDVPSEVLITSMRTHQKYFAVLDAEGRMAPRFIVIANRVTSDGGAAVVAGNERVLRARLSDAKFFWDQDRRTKLEDRLPALEKITFHARLGTVAEKVERMATLAEVVAGALKADAGAARRAATLAKADLVTEVVGEFPEVQGIMGRYYALGQGEPAVIADAVADHYKPVGPSDGCPSAPISIAVAMADKLDTLTGFFAIDEKPTGSKDPYGLRRAALGVIRLVLENRLRLPLLHLFEVSSWPYIKREITARMRQNIDDIEGARERFNRVYGETTGDIFWAAAKRAGEGSTHDPLVDEIADQVLPTFDKALKDLLGFFADRLKVVLRDQGVRHDLVDAVFALGGEDDLVRLLARVEALSTFVGSEDGGNLLAAYKRASNILRIEEKKDGAAYDQPVDAALFAVGEERALFEALTAAQAATAPSLAAEDYVAAMASLSTLRGPVDAFFEKVTVNADDSGLRANRLRLLSSIRATLGAVADFSKIEG